MAKQDNSAQKSGGSKVVVIAAVVVGVLGLGMGFSVTSVLLQTGEVVATSKTVTKLEEAAKEASHESIDAPDTETSEAESTEKLLGEYDVIPLQPIVTNLAGSNNVWIRMESSVLLKKNGEGKPEILASQLSQHILAYLRTLRMSDLQGAGALPAISQDLNEIVGTVSEGQAKGVLVSGLVFECRFVRFSILQFSLCAYSAVLSLKFLIFPKRARLVCQPQAK